MARSRRPPGKGKPRLRVLPPTQARGNPAPASRPAKPTIKNDWAVIAHEGVRLFELYRFGTPEVRERTIHTILRRWKSLHPLRIEMYRGNQRLNELDQQIRELEAQNDRILMRMINSPRDHATLVQRRANIIERRATYGEQIVIIKRLKSQINLFRRKMKPIPASIQRDLHSIAPAFWKQMTDFLLEEVVN